MYHLKHKVRYSEISSDQYVNIAQVVNYLQDCSTFESISVGDTIEYQRQKHAAWMLAGWQLEIERFPEMAEEITISSWHYGHKGILAYRNFDICDAKGQRIVSANSIWFYFDLDKKMPVRILEEYVDMYGHAEKLPMNYKARKITIPKTEGRREEPFRVRKADLDTNGHVNNAKYIEMALEYVEDSHRITSMRADYRKSALYGDRIFPVIYEENNKIYVELRNEEQEIFVVIEFEYRTGDSLKRDE